MKTSDPVLRMAQQMVYDHVVTHLLTQNKRSTDGQRCRYRTAEGLSCAAGCLLPDLSDEEVSRIEGNPVLTIWSLFEDRGYAGCEGLLEGLQSVHDYGNSGFLWEKGLSDLAIRFGLDSSIIGKVKAGLSGITTSVG